MIASGDQLAVEPLTRYPLRHFPIGELGYAIGFILLLLALYVGAYCAMVARGTRLESVKIKIMSEYESIPAVPGGSTRIRKLPVPVERDIDSFRPIAEYRCANVVDEGTLRWLFEPVNSIDRRLRVEYWRFDDEADLPNPYAPKEDESSAP